jgi:hypothetical protein
MYTPPRWNFKNSCILAVRFKTLTIKAVNFPKQNSDWRLQWPHFCSPWGRNLILNLTYRAGTPTQQAEPLGDACRKTPYQFRIE